MNFQPWLEIIAVIVGSVFGSYNQYGSRSLFFKDVWVGDQK